MRDLPRRSGLPIVGDVPLGAHICHFFQTADDLFSTAQQFLSAGLESNELCLWLFVEPYGRERSLDAFRHGMPRFEEHHASGALMVERAEDWLTSEGTFNVPFFSPKWDALAAEVMGRGFDCLRVGGACFPGLRWEEIRLHERSLDDSLGSRPMIFLCSFPLETTEAAAIIDIAQTHHLAIAQRGAHWDVVETPNRRLRQLETKSRQQSAIVALGLQAVRERDLDGLMANAVTTAKETLAMHRALIWQALPEQNEIVFRSTTGWEDLLTGATFPLDAMPVARFIIATDEPVIASDIRAEKRFDGSILRDHGIVSVMSAAIRGRDGVWGGLSVHSSDARNFDQDDLHFMESLANVIALAVERNEHEEAERREHAAAEAALVQLRAIQSITDGPLARMALDELLNGLLSRLRAALRIDLVGVTLWERGRLVCRAMDGGLSSQVGMAIHPRSPVWSRLVKDSGPVIIEDYDRAVSPEFAEWSARSLGPVRSTMGVPLIVEEKLIGSVLASSFERRRFTQDQVDLMRVVADRVAPAIERARLLESLHAERERLEALSHKLLSVQEEERRRLAIELHDELGQVLTAVKINLESTPAQLQNAIENVGIAMQTTRDLALELRPAMLDDLGLAAALRWYADRFARQTRLNVRMAIEPVTDVLPAVAIACFRVAQEALTNVARHARARNVWLDVRRVSSTLELTIRDDGTGFDPEAANARAVQGATLGVVGMKERASLAGGAIEFRSMPGAGTEVRAVFPMRAER